MQEKTFRKKIKQHSKTLGIRAHWESIESETTGQGIPDLNGCLNGKEVWLELKQISAQNTKDIGLGKMQVAWLYKRAKAGGNVWIAVLQQVKSDYFILLWQGKDVLSVKESGTFFPPFALIPVSAVEDWRPFYDYIFTAR